MKVFQEHYQKYNVEVSQENEPPVARFCKLVHKLQRSAKSFFLPWEIVKTNFFNVQLTKFEGVDNYQERAQRKLSAIRKSFF